MTELVRRTPPCECCTLQHSLQERSMPGANRRHEDHPIVVQRPTRLCRAQTVPKKQTAINEFEGPPEAGAAGKLLPPRHRDQWRPVSACVSA